MKNKNNLDFINLLKNRYSVRKFTKEVEEDKIKLILEAGRLHRLHVTITFKIYI